MLSLNIFMSFVDECKYAFGLEENDQFVYLKYGIRKTFDSPLQP